MSATQNTSGSVDPTAVVDQTPVNQTPTPAAGVQDVAPALVDSVTMKFRYRADKLGNQRAEIVAEVPVPNIHGLIDIVQAGADQGLDEKGKPKSKELQLLLENMYDTTRAALVSYLADNENIKDASGIDLSKFTWTAIANQERADRRSNQIPEETWKEFTEDYIAVMPGATGKKVEQVTSATTVFLKKFSMIKTNKPVLSLLKDQLAIYVNTSKNAEQFSEIIDMLTAKVNAYLASDDVAQLVANL